MNNGVSIITIDRNVVKDVILLSISEKGVYYQEGAKLWFVPLHMIKAIHEDDGPRSVLFETM